MNAVAIVMLAKLAGDQRALAMTLWLGRRTMDKRVSFSMRTPSDFPVEFGMGGDRLTDDFVQTNPSH